MICQADINTTELKTRKYQDEIADLEEYAHKDEQPPLCKGYRNPCEPQNLVVIYDPYPTGREILTKAGFVPPKESYLKNDRLLAVGLKRSR